MLKLNKNLLIHAFDYLEYEGEDRNHQPSYKEAQTIHFVRIDFNSSYTRDNSQKKASADAVVFCYNHYTAPFIPFKEQSQVIIDNKTYTIHKVIPLADLHTNDLFGYELEVLS